eukprot:6937017-Prymnesium_polylepis.1
MISRQTANGGASPGRARAHHQVPASPRSDRVSDVEEATEEEKADVEQWIEQLNLEPTLKKLEGLLETLQAITTSEGWLEEFVLSNGVPALYDLLQIWQMKPRKGVPELEMLVHLMRCLRALMNIDVGMQALVGDWPGTTRADDTEGLRAIAMCILSLIHI